MKLTNTTAKEIKVTIEMSLSELDSIIKSMGASVHGYTEWKSLQSIRDKAKGGF